jgi:hypothetical protein
MFESAEVSVLWRRPEAIVVGLVAGGEFQPQEFIEALRALAPRTTLGVDIVIFKYLS